jgi:hypothetical protein
MDEGNKQVIKHESPKNPDRTFISGSTPNPVQHFAAALGLTLAGLAWMAYGLQQPILSPPLIRPARFIVSPAPRLFLDPLIQALGAAVQPATQHLQLQTSKLVLEALEEEQAQNKVDEWSMADMAKTKVKYNDNDLPDQSADCIILMNTSQHNLQRENEYQFNPGLLT